jgi:catechol-2,3-dioxygenase
MAAVSQLKNRELRRMVLGIDNVGVAVRDRERSMAFYQNLGFRKIFQNERGSTMTAGSTKLFLFPAADREVPLRKSPWKLIHLGLII